MGHQTWNGPGPRSLVGALVAAGAAALVSCSASTTAERPPIPPGATLSSWHYNGAGGRYLLQIEDGRTPAQGEKLVGVVKTDTVAKAATKLYEAGQVARRPKGQTFEYGVADDA